MNTTPKIKNGDLVYFYELLDNGKIEKTVHECFRIRGIMYSVFDVNDVASTSEFPAEDFNTFDQNGIFTTECERDETELKFIFLDYLSTKKLKLEEKSKKELKKLEKLINVLKR